MRIALLSTLAFAMVAMSTPSSTALAAQVAVAPGQPAGRLAAPAPKAGRTRPLVVVVAENAGAEITDFTIPYGVLKESGVADVRSLSTGAGPVRLRMALRIIADATLDQIDANEPAGADIVIVPAQMSPKDPALVAWIRAQAAKGATIVSVCEGARVLAHSGLLNGRRAASHWSSLKSLEKAYPSTAWVRDRRYVQDGPIISTAGVSASIPMSLALVEAIGGHAAAVDAARRLGVSDWSPTHRTADFTLARGDVSHALLAALAFWSHETVELPLADGMDEVALALRADAWSRTFRTRIVTTSKDSAAVRTRHGMTILPDERPKAGRHVVAAAEGPAAAQLDASLSQIGARYGMSAVRIAKLGLEYGKSQEP
jgi:transcriptional regulator GlxA family with amidase domain